MERLCSKRDFRKSRTSTHPFVKKLTTVLTIEQFFFSKFEITQWNGVNEKEGFLN